MFTLSSCCTHIQLLLKPAHIQFRLLLFVAMALVASSISKTVCDVLLWQAGLKIARLPNQCSRDPREKKLGLRFAKLLLRRHQKINTGNERKPLRQLCDAEIALVNSVPCVPESGCSTGGADRKVQYALAVETMASYASTTAINLIARIEAASVCFGAGSQRGLSALGDVRFNEKVDKLYTFCQDHQRMPSKLAGDAAERQLAVWVRNIMHRGSEERKSHILKLRLELPLRHKQVDVDSGPPLKQLRYTQALP